MARFESYRRTPSTRNAESSITYLDLANTKALHTLPVGFLPSYLAGFTTASYENSLVLGTSLSCCGLGIDNVDILWKIPCLGVQSTAFFGSDMAAELQDLVTLKNYINNGNCRCNKGSPCSKYATCSDSQSIYRYSCACNSTYTGVGSHCALQCGTAATVDRACLPGSACDEALNVCQCTNAYFDGCYSANPYVPDSGGSSGGLGTLHIVLISLGCAFLVVLCVVAALFYRRYKLNKRSTGNESTDVIDSSYHHDSPKAELSSSSRGMSFGNINDDSYNYPHIEYFEAMETSALIDMEPLLRFQDEML